MSPTYTTWIHHGEEGGGTNIIEPLDVDGSHHDGWIVEEEEQEDRDDNILLDFDDLVQNLLTYEEWARRVPKFKRVSDELKQSVSSGSTFSRFSFLVGCSISSPTIELATTILMHYWCCCQMHSLVATCQNQVRRLANIFENWGKVMKVSMCARTTMCCFGVIVRNCKRAQNAKSLDGRMQMVADRFLIKF